MRSFSRLPMLAACLLAVGADRGGELFDLREESLEAGFRHHLLGEERETSPLLRMAREAAGSARYRIEEAMGRILVYAPDNEDPPRPLTRREVRALETEYLETLLAAEKMSFCLLETGGTSSAADAFARDHDIGRLAERLKRLRSRPPIVGIAMGAAMEEAAVAQWKAELGRCASTREHARFLRAVEVPFQFEEMPAQRGLPDLAILAYFDETRIRVNREVLGALWARLPPEQGLEARARDLAVRTLPLIAHELRHAMLRREMRARLGFVYPAASPEEEFIAYSDTVRVMEELSGREPALFREGRFPELDEFERPLMRAAELGGEELRCESRFRCDAPPLLLGHAEFHGLEIDRARRRLEEDLRKSSATAEISLQLGNAAAAAEILGAPGKFAALRAFFKEKVEALLSAAEK